MNKLSLSKKSFTLLTIALLAVSGFFVANMAQAAGPWTVNPACVADTPTNGDCNDSNTYKTIQAAITAASPEDMINVAEGTYNTASGETFPIIVDKGVTLKGAGKTSTFIQAPIGDNGMVVTTSGSSGNTENYKFEDIQIVVSGTGRGINVVGDPISYISISLENTTINYSETGRGISLGSTGASQHDNAISLVNSNIECAATGLSNQANRGISYYMSSDSTLTLTNSTVTAGHYALTLNSPGLVANISGSTLTGYAALNLHNSDSVINIEDSTLTGKTFWSATGNNDYGTIAFDTAINTTVNIIDSIITNQFVDTANSWESLFLNNSNVGNKVYLDDATVLTNTNKNYAPFDVRAYPYDSDFQWFIDGELQTNNPLVDIYVNTTIGNDTYAGDQPTTAKKTIQAAINAAAPGDTINVAAGIYIENVVINVPNLTLQSTAGRDLTIIDNPNAPTVTIGIYVNKNLGTITVDGFTANNFRNGIIQSYSQSEGTSFIVKNCKVIPENDGTGNAYLRNGIQVSGDGSKIIDNIVVGAPLTHDWSSSAIGVVNASNVLVQGNVVTGPADIGIDINNYSSTLVNNITINNNQISGALSGVTMEASSSNSTPNVQNVFITNNILKDSQTEGQGVNVERVTLTNLTITGNEITGNDHAGVRFSETSATIAGDILLNNNYLSGNTSYGIDNGTTYSINATNNWWGNASGPHNAISNPSGTGDEVNANVIFSPWYIDAEKTTLSDSITVTFNSNGGSDISSIADVAYGATVTLPTAPTRTGYTFDSWKTAADGSGTTFDASTPVVANVTVYAKWTVVVHGPSGSYTRPATPAVPAQFETPDGCALGNKFSTTTGRNCNAATPAVPAGQVLGASTGPIPGCGNRTTGFSVATGESCVGNSTGKVLGAETVKLTFEELKQLIDQITKKLQSLLVQLVQSGKITPSEANKYLAGVSLIQTDKASDINRDLYLGLQGEDVKLFQSFLINQKKGSKSILLSSYGSTGYFGPVTQSALAEYQASVSIRPAIGYFGPITRNYLKSIGY